MSEICGIVVGWQRTAGGDARVDERARDGRDVPRGGVDGCGQEERKVVGGMREVEDDCRSGGSGALGAPQATIFVPPRARHDEVRLLGEHRVEVKVCTFGASIVRVLQRWRRVNLEWHVEHVCERLHFNVLTIHSIARHDGAVRFACLFGEGRCAQSGGGRSGSGREIGS